MGRKYRDYGVEEAASIIVCECVRSGKSTGWSGSLEELEAVEKTCKDFNVKYVNDFKGEWQLRK